MSKNPENTPDAARTQRANPEKAMSQICEVTYTPVWNVPKNYLTGFIAKPVQTVTGLSSATSEKIKADIDIAVLKQAGKDLADTIGKGNKLVVIVPVCLSTLDNYLSANQYLQYCRNISPGVRSLMALKIQGIKSDFSIHKMHDALRDLPGLMRSIILSVSLRQNRYEVPANCHIHAFSASLLDTPTSEQKYFDLFDRFVEKIQALNHSSMIEDIHSRPLLCAAIGSGLTYISGPAIQTEQSSLDTIRPFDLAEAYRAAK